MARTRNQNKAAHTAQVHKLSISEMERVFLTWLFGNIQGLDRDGSRYVARISTEFDLEEFQGVKPEDRFNEYDYELSGYEIQFILDQIEKAFNDRKVPPAYARYSLELEEVLRDALQPKEDTAEVAEAE